MSHHVVVLGAGLGSRLKPLTDDRPKCVVELAGEPLAVRLLRQLAERGVKEATVVIGHFAERAAELIDGHLSGHLGEALEQPGPKIRIRYVENREYATTNTMYSTLLAMSALADGGYLVEGDIAASDEAIRRLVAADPGHSHWAAEPWTPAHSGCRLRADDQGRILGQEIWRHATVGSTAGLWKSAGMLKLTAADAGRLAAHLHADAESGRRGVYYDDVLGARIGEFDLHIVDLTGAPWIEIDDLDDMARARSLFEEQ